MGKWLVRACLAATVTLVAAIFALPRFHLVLWGLLGWSAATAVVVGVVRNQPRRRLPWLLMALALAAFVTGDMVYDVLTQILGQNNPFPSPADVFYLATYPLIACGLVAMVRARSRDKNLGALLDALIVTASCALLSWIYLIQPYVRAHDMTLFQKVISISYPLGDIAILCVLARLLAAGGLRHWSVRFLTLGAVGVLAADVAYGTIQLNGNWKVGGPTDVGWVLFYVCWGAAALHPSMRHLTENAPRRTKQLSLTTLIVLSGTTLVAPGLLVWQVVTVGVSHDAGVIGATSGLVFVLVMARLTGLARTQAAQAGRERALRATGERLVAATELEAVDAAAIAAVRAMVGPAVSACLVTETDGRLQRVVAGDPAGLCDALLEVEEIAGREPTVLVRRPDGDTLPGRGAGTRWTSMVVGGLNSPCQRVLMAHKGPLPVGSGDVIEALAAQLTLAADRVELAKDLYHHQSETRFRSLIQNASDVILVAQANGALRSETPSTETVLGYSPEAAGALRLDTVLHSDDAPAAIASIEALLGGTRSGPIRADWRVRHADGRWLDMEVIGNDLSDDAHVAGVVLTMRDVTDRKTLEQELCHRAFHDSLTNLANRVLFNDRVDQALSRKSRSGTDVAVLLIDVDDFKVVNDTLGHAAGDELLVQLAGRLLGCLRDGDTAARLGGDEFAVCIEFDSRTQSDVAAMAQRVLDAMVPPFRAVGHNLSGRVSVGISVAADKTEGTAGMLREADLALYAAKNAGKGTHRFFDPSLHKAMLARLEQRTALQSAIEAGDLRLHYQPIIRLADGDVVGVEALVRWEDPVLGLVPPVDFIPLAEESALVVPLGRWVLDRACFDLSRWQEQGIVADGRPFHMAVNVSPRQLQATDFLEMVDDTLARHRIDPSRLTLEITESVLVQDSEEVMTRLGALHDRGITLALDDFGTGYSSLSYLHRFPIQILKIDRSFVAGMDNPGEGRTILNAIVSLAASLDLELVAEGIEHESQARQLQLLGCQYGQGFYLGRPVPVEAMDERLDPMRVTSAPQPGPNPGPRPVALVEAREVELLDHVGNEPRKIAFGSHSPTLCGIRNCWSGSTVPKL